MCLKGINSLEKIEVEPVKGLRNAGHGTVWGVAVLNSVVSVAVRDCRLCLGGPSQPGFAQGELVYVSKT